MAELWVSFTPDQQRISRASGVRFFIIRTYRSTVRDVAPNQTILEQILSNDTVSWHYFDYHHLSSKWLEKRLRLSLAALGPRYTEDFNVSTGIATQLDMFLCNNSAVTQINDAKNEVIKRLKESQQNMLIAKSFFRE